MISDYRWLSIEPGTYPAHTGIADAKNNQRYYLVPTRAASIDEPFDAREAIAVIEEVDGEYCVDEMRGGEVVEHGIGFDQFSDLEEAKIHAVRSHGVLTGSLKESLDALSLFLKGVEQDIRDKNAYIIVYPYGKQGSETQVIEPVPPSENDMQPKSEFRFKSAVIAAGTLPNLSADTAIRHIRDKGFATSYFPYAQEHTIESQTDFDIVKPGDLIILSHKGIELVVGERDDDYISFYDNDHSPFEARWLGFDELEGETVRSFAAYHATDKQIAAYSAHKEHQRYEKQTRQQRSTQRIASVQSVDVQTADGTGPIYTVLVSDGSKDAQLPPGIEHKQIHAFGVSYEHVLHCLNDPSKFISATKSDADEGPINSTMSIVRRNGRYCDDGSYSEYSVSFTAPSSLQNNPEWTKAVEEFSWNPEGISHIHKGQDYIILAHLSLEKDWWTVESSSGEVIESFHSPAQVEVYFANPRNFTPVYNLTKDPSAKNQRKAFDDYKQSTKDKESFSKQSHLKETER